MAMPSKPLAGAPAPARESAPAVHQTKPHRTYYAQLIQEATGVDDDNDLAELETIMRQEIFHSTLDWQTRDQLTQAAREAREVQLYLQQQGLGQSAKLTS